MSIEDWRCKDRGHEFWCRFGAGSCRQFGPQTCNAEPESSEERREREGE